MAGKKVREEIESIRSEVKQLAEAVWGLRDLVQRELAASAASRSSSSPSIGRHSRVAALEESTGAAASAGAISAFGYYEVPGDGGRLRWALDTLPVETALETLLPDSAATLAAIGHPQRLAILTAILRKPASAGELVETLSLGTTGAAYHHLNVLQAAGFVTQAQRGTFRFAPENIPIFLTILAALSDRMQVETTPSDHS